ncbi:protein IQ-DOMAIN 19 isoform X2 [Ricinus communis]|uniref:protein IQ-DOMAIN 19 isoform X2 n=1 Tax=Ricinus communis TaxID=3988 RepID=UPI00201AC69F|nr:protein IQ-DOMAIN 19 isoform X2 [Ricinus communis]
MGKASSWIMNFLVGKKEEKEKRKNITFYEDYMRTPNGSIPSTPNYKRRWSFGKSSGREKVNKNSKSLDAITPLITQHAAPLEWENRQNRNKTVAAVPAPAEAIKRVVATREDRIIRSVEEAAATRIQAAYRSYLFYVFLQARRALCALRALVKLQALVRGHLVRRQTAATLQQMHALMAIQVRARCQRIQMAKESAQLVVRSLSSRHGNFPLDSELRGALKAMDLNVYETKRVLKDDHGYLDHPQMGRREHGKTKYYSGEIYISKRKDQYEEFSFPTVPNSPENYSPSPVAIRGRASFTYQKPDYMQPICHPNYMANTESSRAKVRSQSEPKQRPKGSMRPEGKGTAPMNGSNAQQDGRLQGSSSYSMSLAYENRDPWLTKVFQSSRHEDCEYDAKSKARSSYSNCNKLLAACEPHLYLY